MDTVTIIIVAVLVVAGIALLVMANKRRTRVESRREELTGAARAHRQEADAQVSAAASVGPEADQHRLQAEQHRQEEARHGDLAGEHESAASELEARTQRAGQAAARHDEKAVEAEQELRRTN